MAGIFSKIKNAYALFQSVDFDKMDALSKKIDLKKMVDAVASLDETQINGLMKMLGTPHKKKELPAINGDFYHLGDSLNEEERALQLKVRAFLEKEVKPLVNDYWLKAEFPFELIPKIAELNICGLTYQGYGCPVNLT